MNTSTIDADDVTRAAIAASRAAALVTAMDAALARVSSRELIAGTEVVNLLLDLRQLASAVADQSVERA
jgi:hypothetical protein